MPSNGLRDRVRLNRGSHPNWTAHLEDNMARIQRLHRVVATYRNGDVSEWHYIKPEDAKRRAAQLAIGRTPALNEATAAAYREAGEAAPLDVPVGIRVEQSHEILWPHVAGDAATVDAPGTTIAWSDWADVLALFGIQDATRVLALTWHPGEQAVLELSNGKHNPTHWSAEIITSENED